MRVRFMAAGAVRHMSRRQVGSLAMAWLLGGLALPRSAAAAPPKVLENPYWQERIKAGSLPPVSARIPGVPMVVSGFAGHDGPGQPGGSIVTLGAERDTRLMATYGYTRLVAFEPDLSLRADILESYTVEDGRRFTLRLRPGHRWSDGQPFTADDFRYWWEDVANNRELSPNGPPAEMLVDNKPPVFEVVDPATVRFTWQAPNPYFLEAMARALPLFIYRPAHYLRQFHAKYVEPQALEELVKKWRMQGWARLHNRVDQMYVGDNPDLPSLSPWVPKTKPPSTRLVYERNPYYHRIDSNGVQLPYLDQVVLSVVSPTVIPLKSGSGETDLQARYLKFDDYTYLKGNTKTFPFEVLLWETGNGSELALYPNFNHNDPVLRTLFRDPRFRRALSMSIDRDEVNEVVFMGMAHPSNNTIRPGSPLFQPAYRELNAKHDIKQAGKLLDEIGLTKRDSENVRLMPDGRPLVLVAETAGETKEQTDILSLIQSTWRRAGIKLLIRPQTRDLLRQRVAAGETMISVWPGVENAMPTAASSPREFAPGTLGDLQWPKWGLYRESKGKAGEPCDMPAVQRLIELVDTWEKTVDPEAQTAIWREILTAHAEQQFSIGVVSGSQQPVVINRKLRNVPRNGIYSWHPGSFFGMYRPDTFWLQR